ncbi:hypothetical protein IscW_ISCW021425 [Ixodes scapularis]|uniref:Uncharacterized protein n=1 Tax=Ixodes scapularis TaxID=6945 RepID=B7Q625_IXOSC|nr:hypothetical protein IscW_ISCW021425 [Ixodes scapularis]|eukprot:XP_002411872.1 hypothetical protein IscW_ISCW021425 [Ixodes scapularis]
MDAFPSERATPPVLHEKPPILRSDRVLSWICKNGADALSKHAFVADSLSAIQDQEYEFEKFYFLAMVS